MTKEGQKQVRKRLWKGRESRERKKRMNSKVKLFPFHNMKACRGSRGITPIIEKQLLFSMHLCKYSTVFKDVLDTHGKHTI